MFAKQIEDSPTHSPSPLQPTRILVADDEHLLAKGISDDLQELNYEVIGPAANGKLALELASREPADLALLDIRMPEMDGIEAARLLYLEHNMPTVIVTAHSDPDYIQRAAEIGVFGYLLKPVTTDDLRAIIPIAWGRHLEQRELSDEVSSLETKLENRKLIEKAKGLIMKNMGLDEPEAMRRLQRQARDSRRPMVELAKSIIESHDLMKPDEK